MEKVVDATFVINMDNDKDRLIEFNDMMQKLNWKYERHQGINGKNLFINEGLPNHYHLTLKERYLNWFNFLSYSEIGCMLSHISLWEKVALDPTLNRIAIFEDDARTHLSGSTPTDLLNDFYDYLRDNDVVEPDVLYLGKCLDNCITYEKVWNNVYISSRPLCLHSYIMSKKGAQKLLNLGPYTGPIDSVPPDAHKRVGAVLMAFHPSLFFQDILSNTSNLRSLGLALNNSTECLVSQQHIPEETSYFMGIVIIGLVIICILYLIFISMG
jgi:hypothetical protein